MELYQRTGILPPRVHLAIDRLLYAQRLFRVGPGFLQEVLRQEFAFSSKGTSWMHGLVADLRWIDAVGPGRLPDGWLSDLGLIIDMWQSP